MALLKEEVQERIKQPKKKNEIRDAIQHEDRLRFHTETHLDESHLRTPINDFLGFARQLLPDDKFFIFASLFSYPVATVSLTKTIYTELERVFDGKNPAFNYEFKNHTARDDWEIYREEKLREPIFWQDDVWDEVKTSINSFLVVDLPREQNGSRPEPYYYILDIRNVIDYVNKGDVVESIIFYQSDNEIAVIDDVSYRVFEVEDKKQFELSKEIVNNVHNLGKCPVRFLWTDKLNKENPDIKRSPLTAELATLDWLLFYATSKKHLDLYASYPIYSSYEIDCDYEDRNSGNYCQGGLLKDSTDQFITLRDGKVLKCPVCANKRLAGVGASIEKPIPKPGEADIGDPVTITTIDDKSLKYNVEEVSRLTNKIYTNVLGETGDIQQRQSLNELQIEANFESKTNALNAIKNNLENIIKFADETCCRIRYGSEFIKCSISLGTKYYAYSVPHLRKQYETARKSGASEVELDFIQEQIIMTEHRNNPTQLQRMLMLKQLEPYRHKTQDELMTLYDKGLISADLFVVKVNFNRYIERFERENTNILEFGMQLTFSVKVDKIIQTLISYGKSDRGTAQQSNEQTGG